MIKFSEWLLEAKLDRNFNIDVAGEDYKVIRTVHVKQKISRNII
jgi:hypothetical protein